MACYKFYSVPVLPANHPTHNLTLALGESDTTTSNEDDFSSYMFRILKTIFSRTLGHFQKGILSFKYDTTPQQQFSEKRFWGQMFISELTPWLRH
jgi:hypothetical protein